MLHPLGLLLLLQTPATGQTPQGQQPTTASARYQNVDTGYAFDYPSSWARQKPPKGRANVGIFLIPLGEEKAAARLEVYSADFRGQTEEWQRLQQDINLQLRRKVVRQWQEDLLGVPLLLDKVEYTDKVGLRQSLNGLLFTRTNKKLLFRLDTTSGHFDEAETTLRAALQSLRTVDGSLPDAENPDAAPQPKPTVTPNDNIIHIDAPKVVHRPVKGAQQIKTTVDGKSIVVNLGPGFTATPTATGVEISSPDFSTKVVVLAKNIITAPPASIAMTKLGNADLDSFDRVDLREEVTNETNKLGAACWWVMRRGINSKGPLFSVIGIGATGDWYWQASYVGNKLPTEKEVLALKKLFANLALAPAQ